MSISTADVEGAGTVKVSPTVARHLAVLVAAGLTRIGGTPRGCWRAEMHG